MGKQSRGCCGHMGPCGEVRSGVHLWGYHLHSGGATSRIHRVGLGEGSGGVYVPEHLSPRSLALRAPRVPGRAAWCPAFPRPALT